MALCYSKIITTFKAHLQQSRQKQNSPVFLRGADRLNILQSLASSSPLYNSASVLWLFSPSSYLSEIYNSRLVWLFLSSHISSPSLPTLNSLATSLCPSRLPPLPFQTKLYPKPSLIYPLGEPPCSYLISSLHVATPARPKRKKVNMSLAGCHSHSPVPSPRFWQGHVSTSQWTEKEKKSPALVQLLLLQGKLRWQRKTLNTVSLQRYSTCLAATKTWGIFWLYYHEQMSYLKNMMRLMIREKNKHLQPLFSSLAERRLTSTRIKLLLLNQANDYPQQRSGKINI